jgi:hypothetical protein
MDEPKTHFCKSFMNRNIYYDVDENGLIYRPEDEEELSIRWMDIQYIEDRPGNRVDIFLNTQKEIPVGYETSEFPVFLKSTCFKLAEIRNESFYCQKFTITRLYLLHLSFVASAIVLPLMGSLFVGKVLFFALLTIFVPFGIFILRQPISVTLNKNNFVVDNLLANSAIKYSEIEDIGFEVKRNDYGRTLCLWVHLKNGKRMIFKKFDNIILIFVMLQIKLKKTKRE